MTERELLLSIDVCHARLITGLVAALKPRRVLEFGYGAGVATRAIVDGLAGESGCEYTLVDNWEEAGGKMPALELPAPFNVVTSEEGDFVKAHATGQWDLIMSDADHDKAHVWDNYVFHSMLAPGGILIYHDVGGEYAGLAKLVDVHYGRSVLFNKSTQPGERCERGLLVVFKRAT